MSISSTLKIWYLQNKRDLPWRNTTNPYYIWVSEVILQQTRVAQGLPYYERFVLEYPDIAALANTQEEKLLKIWQGLGYYSRARNLQKGARYVMDHFKGKIPSEYEQLLSICGIGDYTASAIASIAFNLPYAVVDGNVNRVISRLFGVFEPVNSLQGKNKIKQIANELLDREEPGIYNQAIMEFGALFCTPRNPECNICPLKNTCYASLHNKEKELPVKISKSLVQRRYFNYLVLLNRDTVIFQKRTQSDIWQGLFEFPMIETDTPVTIEELTGSGPFKTLLGNMPYSVTNTLVKLNHKLTHRTIEASFIVIYIKDSLKYDGYIRVPFNEIPKYPVSRLIHKYLEKYFGGWDM